MNIKRNSIILVVLTLLILCTSACETGGTSAVDGVQVIHDMQKAIAGVKSSHTNLDVHIAINFPSIKGDVSIEVWQRSPAEVRAELHSVSISGLDDLMGDGSGNVTPTAAIHEPTIPGVKESICPATGKPITTTTIDSPDFKPSDLQGSILVSDGQRVWMYTPALCQVYISSAEQAETTPTQMQAMIDALPSLLDKVLEVADVKGIGVEQVGDRAAYKLELTPKPGVTSEALANGKVTLWVDKERSLPLKLVYDVGSMGQVSISVANIEVNQPLDDKLFRFTVPNNVAVIDLDAGKPQNTTLPQARKDADYPILIPSYLPGDSVLVGVTQINPSQPPHVQGGRITTLNYQGNRVNFDIIEGKGGAANEGNVNEMPNPPAGSTTEIITVRGVDARLITTTGTDGSDITIYWNDKLGTVVNISGNLSRDEMIKVAESLK